MSQKMQVGNWSLGVGETRVLEEYHVNRLTELVSAWSDIETGIRKKDEVPVWAVQELGVPTILCRVDLAPFGIGETPAEKIYEIEARPAGFGVLLNLVPEFKKIRSFFEPLMPIGAVVLDSREVAAEDTRVFSEAMGWKWVSPEHCNNGIPKHMWARGSSLDNKIGVDLSYLEKRALAPVTSHGDKKYLLKMGLAKNVACPEDLPWDEPFVIKPLKGSKSDSVFLWHPEERKKKSSGLYTKGKISSALLEDRPFVLQPFILPDVEEHEAKRGFTIWRIYFAYDVRNSTWSFAGGLWNWRPCLKVHGASDSIAGPLIS